MTDKLFKGKAHGVGIMLSGNYEDNANCINVCTLSRYFARVVSVIKVILIGAGITNLASEKNMRQAGEVKTLKFILNF